MFPAVSKGGFLLRVRFFPIWIADSCNPARWRSVEGETELLEDLDIIRTLGITVVFGSNNFRAGQGEFETMTYIEKQHWVFPLSPTSFAYA